MTSSEFGLLDIATVVGLANDAHGKCMGADFDGLAPALKSTGALVDQMQQTFASRFDKIASQERQNLYGIIKGPKITIGEVIRALDDRSPGLQTKFGLFENPAAAAAVLSMWQMPLNVWIIAMMIT